MRNCDWVFALLLAAALPAYPQGSHAPDDETTGWRKVSDAPTSPFAVPAGIWITIRVNEPLSSDRNQPGDTFTATLAQPLVANGRVIARRGQTVAGVVVEARKAGNVK